MSSLGERQEELIKALVANGPLPDGFDAGAIAVAAAALLRKRASEVARHIPIERDVLGDRYAELFSGWANGRPKTTSHADAGAFLEHLYQSGELERPVRRSRWWSVLRRP